MRRKQIALKTKVKKRVTSYNKKVKAKLRKEGIIDFQD